MKIKLIHFISYALILATSFSGCATRRSPDGGNIQSGLDREVDMGIKIHQEIMSSFYPYTKPEVVEYVNKVGNTLVDNNELKDFSYRFTILYNEKIYATSAPGGFVYVTTGMIRFLDNEAQLAAVLAHELGQVQYQDPRLSSNRKILTGITQVGAVVAPAFGPLGSLAVLGLVAANVFADSKEKTEEERLEVADAYALTYLVNSGYEPQALENVMYKFLTAPNHIIPYFHDYYQGRPITQTRVTALKDVFAKLDLSNQSFMTNPQVYQLTMRPVRQMYQY